MQFNSDILELLEYTAKDILRGIDHKSDQRSKERFVNYQGMFQDEARFSCKGTAPKPYTEKIKLVDLEESLQLKGMNLRDRVNLAVSGNLLCSCSCPAFLYQGYKYIATQLDFNLDEPEDRFPTIRNPNLKGTVCKHLIQVLRVLPFHIGSITADIKKSPEYSKYVSIQENKNMKYFTIKEDIIEKYTNIGAEFKLLPIHVVVHNADKKRLNCSCLNENNDILLLTRNKNKYDVLKGYDLISDSIKNNCSHIPTFVI